LSSITEAGNPHTLKVCVLMGGIGEERQVSLESGKSVASALQQAGLDVITCDIRPDKLYALENDDIDVFFIALHGVFGEDGQLQQILEEKSLVYTGSGPEASRLAFDKWESKKLFEGAGVKTAPAVRFDPMGVLKKLQDELSRMGDKYVVKPLRQGSTIGISIAAEPEEAVAAARQCWKRFGECMIEKFIPGREITVGILEDKVLPIIEIKTKSGFYDYQAKYFDDQTQFLFGTIDDPDLIGRIEASALHCFNTLGCREFGRVDFILGDDRQVYALEVNTIPGFTSHSLLPQAAAKAGISMSRLCMMIVEAAYRRSNRCSGKPPAGLDGQAVL